jgi:putative salt-induced outer membrane protein YdiY
MKAESSRKACALVVVLAGAVGLGLMASSARADEVILKNGDHITGTIETADGGKLKIKTAMMGEVTVDMANVKTFSTDEPVKLQMKDGSLINQKVSGGSEGQVETVPGGTIAPQPIALNKVEKINPPPVAWTGSIVVNGLLSQGNTSSEQLGANLDITRRTEDDRITLGAGYLYGRQKVAGVTSTTDNNWFIAGKYDYFFTTKLYGYANARVEKDTVQNLNIRVTPGVGGGYQWIEAPDFKFNTEAGVSWVYEDFSTEPTPEENVSIRLAYHLEKGFDDDKFKITNNLQYFPSVQDMHDYLLLFDAGLRVALTKTMFSEIKTEVDYDNTPAPGSKRTNVKYILGVGWTF